MQRGPRVAGQNRRDVRHIHFRRGVRERGLHQPHKRERRESGLILLTHEQPEVVQPHAHRLRVHPGVLVFEFLRVEPVARVRVRHVLRDVRFPEVQRGNCQVHHQRLSRFEQPFQFNGGKQAVGGNFDGRTVAEDRLQPPHDQPVVRERIGVDFNRPQAPDVVGRPARGPVRAGGEVPVLGLELVRLEEHALVPVDRPGRHYVILR